MVGNRLMRELLEHIQAYPEMEKLETNLKGLRELFSPPFKQVRDCVTISTKSVKQLNEGMDAVIEAYYKDRTGYEASNTETRINDYFENEISMETGTIIALLVIDVWTVKLKAMEPDSKFCIIMCSDEDRVEIRFHKVRDDEKSWLAEDIEGYTGGAVGYVIV